MTITRFAPSPTGEIHVGNARTAIFNFLITRQTSGTFILRIDDTDPVRSKQKYIDAIKEDLDWLGLNWDTVEQQSHRIERYKEVAQNLMAEGLLYECFETPQQLEVKRKIQLKRGRPPVYDREALTLTESQKKLMREQSRGYWRFKLERTRVQWDDAIQGEVSIDTASVSDPVLIRADGQFLYTFASVVDDHDMHITDIVRGADHITNTAAQIELFRKLGSHIPNFSHHSLLTDENGGPLSKRIGGLSLNCLKNQGIEPMALISQLAFLGSSKSVEVKVKLSDVIDTFDIKSFNRNSTKYYNQTLRSLTTEYFRKVPFEDIKHRIIELDVPDSEAYELWECLKGNIEKVDDIAGWWKIFSGAGKPTISEDDREFVQWAFSLLPNPPYTINTWTDWITLIKEDSNRRGKKIFMPLRLALTGRETGPDMSQCLALFKTRPEL
ncbi:MAG: glutamate--tRNA ligase [Rhodobacteraceae bacterium]|nr:glutamate--tRNA ligase [Paracoccaceae bacterium]